MRGVRTIGKPSACRAQLNETAMPRSWLREDHRGRADVTVEGRIGTVVGEGHVGQHAGEHIRYPHSAPSTRQISADDITSGIRDGERSGPSRARACDVRYSHRETEISSHPPLAAQEIRHANGSSLTGHTARAQYWVYARCEVVWVACPIIRR